MSTFPQKFRQLIEHDLGDEAADFFKSLEEPAPVSVRFNPRKQKHEFSLADKIEWCTNAYYIDKKPSFTFDPFFHAGNYYVQEASSMLLEHVWRSSIEIADPVVLDLCAAPGGKSTQLLSLLGGKGLLVSNEVIPNRNAALCHNISKWGYENVIVTQARPESFRSLSEMFDVIVVDAPCSGEGLFRKDPKSVNEWSDRTRQICEVRQQHILQQVISSLKPGGMLIYSTCTYNPGENDGIIRMLMDTAEFSPVKVASPVDGIVSTKYGLQCYSHKVKGEGFYISVLKRSDSVAGAHPPVSAKEKKKTTLKITGSEYLAEPQKFNFHEGGNRTYAFTPLIARYYPVISKSVMVKQAGIVMGEVKGNDLVPSAELALSTCISSGIRRAELSREEAISFLQCKDVPLRLDGGWHLASYEGAPLGWLKSVGNRNNNYHPRGWRILKQQP